MHICIVEKIAYNIKQFAFVHIKLGHILYACKYKFSLKNVLKYVQRMCNNMCVGKTFIQSVKIEFSRIIKARTVALTISLLDNNGNCKN